MTAAPPVTVDTLDRLRALVTAPGDGGAERDGGSCALRPIGLREIVSGPGAARTVGDVLRRLGVDEGPAVVFGDATAKAAGGGDVRVVVTRALPDHRPLDYVVHPASRHGTVLADEDTVEGAVAGVRALSPACLVTVGSGTIADIGKVVAHRLDLVHVVVQTAASVNGFADDQSVLLVNGAKRTTPTRWPDALVIDPEVLGRAPLAMTRSGLGDQLSTFTAAADWYLASRVGIDVSYSPTVVRLMRGGSTEWARAADALGRGDADAVMLLADALTRGGLAMGIAGRTAPSSGAEHTVAHLLEMQADARGEPTASHGSRVGAAGVVAAAVWQRVRAVLAAGGTRIRIPDAESQLARIRAAFLPLDGTGRTAQECWTGYRRKLDWMTCHRDRLQSVCDDWAGADAAFDDLLAPPDLLAGTLRRAGAAARFADLDPAPQAETVVWAVQHCHLMRDRFGVIDLAELLGLWTPSDVAAVLARTQDDDGRHHDVTPPRTDALPTSHGEPR
jgi:glycerol-1-phosphate dehydrogenase [NAD(P)+]